MWHWIIDNWYVPVVVVIVWMIAAFGSTKAASDGDPARQRELTESLKKSLKGKR
ncbi:MAG: hypothetical protein WCT27_04745 [Patescibacteria group bacterium]|jgi:hypothetical protein